MALNAVKYFGSGKYKLAREIDENQLEESNFDRNANQFQCEWKNQRLREGFFVVNMQADNEQPHWPGQCHTCFGVLPNLSNFGG